MTLTPRAAILHQLEAIRRFIKRGSPDLAIFEVDRLEKSMIRRFDHELGIGTQKEDSPCCVRETNETRF